MKLDTLGMKQSHLDAMQALKKQDLLIARVINESKSAYIVFSEIGDSYAHVSGAMQHNAQSRSDFPIVGDWVAIQAIDSNKAVIHHILPRQNTISRKVVGEATAEQPISANVDFLFIMMGLDHNFNYNRIERYINLALNCNTKPVVILNKKDLLSEGELEDIKHHVADISTQTPFHFICSKNKDTLNVLQPYFADNNTIAMVGSSGVGKSTLVNLFLGTEAQKTNETRSEDSKGKHTTTSRTLFTLPNGGVLIDTPGMRELQLWTDEDNIINNFSDIEQLSAHCKFGNCLHKTEPGCAVLKAISDGHLQQSRLTNYHKLTNELKQLLEQKKGKSRDSRPGDRKFSKMRHNYLKNKSRDDHSSNK